MTIKQEDVEKMREEAIKEMIRGISGDTKEDRMKLVSGIIQFVSLNTIQLQYSMSKVLTAMLKHLETGHPDVLSGREIENLLKHVADTMTKRFEEVQKNNLKYIV